MARQSQRLTEYSDTITVTENARVVTVVYDIGGGAQLPDTAMPRPVDGVLVGAVAVIGASIAVLSHARRRVPQNGP